MKSELYKNRLVCYIVLIVSLVILSSCTTKDRVNPGDYREREKSYQDAFHAFDTECTINIYGDIDEATSKVYFDKLKELFYNYNKMFSKTDSESEVYKINHRDSDIVSVSKEVAEIFAVAKEMYDWSSGYFDVSAGALFDLWDVKNRTTLPDPHDIAKVMPLTDNFNYDVEMEDDVNEIIFYNNLATTYDFGALIKGYACDAAKNILVGLDKIDAAIINLGGNVYCYGEMKDREDGLFNVGIYKPFSTGEIIETVKVKNKSVITSGNYQRYFKVEGDNRIYHHIINPKTGYPTDNGIDSVSIISENALLGDYLSTTCMILGEEYAKKLIDGCRENFDDDIKAIFIYADGRISKY